MPVPSTITAAAVGVIGLSAAMVFTASLGHLLATPRLYGVSWDALVMNLQNSSMKPVADSIARDPQVSQWSGTYGGRFAADHRRRLGLEHVAVGVKGYAVGHEFSG